MRANNQLERFGRGRGRRWALTAGASAATRLIGALAGLALTPYLLSELGREQFGLYALSLGLVSWLSALDIGIVPGVRVLLARDSGRVDPIALTRTVSSATAGQLALAALTLGAGGALAAGIPLLADEPLLASAEARTLILLLAAGSAVSVAVQALAAALEAHQMGYAERGVRVLRTVVRLTAAIALLEAGVGLPALGWAHLTAAVAGGLGLAWTTVSRLPELRLSRRAVDWKTLKQAVRPGLWLTGGTVAGLLIAAADRLVAARLLSLEAVTTLAVSAALFLLAESLLGFLTDAARPLLAQSLGQEDTAGAAELYQGCAAGTAVLAVVASAAALTANRSFVTAWAGAENYGGWELDAALAAALFTQAWTLPHRALLTGALRVRPTTLARLAEGLLNLPLSIALAVRFGLPGVLWGTAAAALLTSAWTLPRLAGQVLDLDSRAVWEPLKRAAGCAVLLFPASQQLRALELEGYAGAAFSAGVIGSAGLLLLWTFGLDSRFRRTLRRPFALAS